MMEVTVSMKLQAIVRDVRHWFFNTPQRALNQAYRAASTIQAIENDHFNGQKVSAEFSDYNEGVIHYFQSEVKRYLRTIKVRLAEFRLCRNLLGFCEIKNDRLEAEIIQQLKFIEEVISKYKGDFRTNSSFFESIASQALAVDSKVNLTASPGESKVKDKKSIKYYSNGNQPVDLETVSDKTAILPRSIFDTFRRIQQEIDPKSQQSEQEVINQFRQSRYKAVVSVKFILLLIIVPLLTHQLTKTFVFSPVVERFFENHPQILFINNDLEEEALMELRTFEENLHFKSLIGLSPPLSPEEIEEKLKDKAKEIAEEYRSQGHDGVANIFADLCSLLAFTLIIALSPKEIEIVKSFLDQVIYGLSDSAKAFMIILVTDMFVGFHSPHGWEVILEGIARHFGLPENRDFIFLFIATFPVILDTIMKYWIFRYLNRLSPSAVATYRNMNE